MQFWRRVRIFLVWAILIFSLVLTTIASLVYYNRESLIELFVEKANRYLNSPIEINSIDLDITGNFPYATFRLNHVKVYESTDIAMDYLAEAEKIEFSYNVLLLLFRQYEINALSMYNARVNIGRGSEGARNYMIFQKNDQGSTDMEFSLKTISLYNTTVNYLDTENEVMFSVRTNELESKLRYSNDLLKVDLAGRIRNDSLVVRGISYLQGEVLELNTNFEYQFSESQINFDESRILINGHEFSLSGYINSGSLKAMDLDIASRKNDMHALVSLMPAPVRQSLSEFKSEGEITFSGKIAGEFSEGNRPAISFIFNGKDVDFYYPGYKNSFNRLNFSGYYNNGDSHDFAGSSLVIEHFSGYIDEHNIQGKLSVNNFITLDTRLSLKGNVALEALLQTFPVSMIKEGSGAIDFNILLHGEMRNVSGNAISTIEASGEVSVEDMSFVTAYSPLPFNDFYGTFQFNNLDLGIQHFRGKIGKSDFRLKGFFKNIIPYLVRKDRPIKIEADLVSEYLDLNELFTLNFSPRDDQTRSKYSLNISPKLDINFNCDVERVELNRFEGNRVTGNLIIRDKIAIVENASMETMGGELRLSGSIVSKHPYLREFIVDGTLKKIEIDSVFYVFNNFNQDFLQYQHLDGEINADVNTYFMMDNDFRFFPETLTSYIDATIFNGTLINFTPMYSLSKYMKEADLSHIEFAELKNSIQVKDKEVLIPDMEIISVPYHIFVSGKHGFDQVIEYHFKIPLNQFRKEDRDNRFGTIENDEEGIPNLFLKMEGRADDFNVNLDTEAVKEKIKDDLKKEGQELKELFRKKEEKPKQAELEEDEYIDF